MKIERAERHELLAGHPILAGHLKRYQQLTYDPANCRYRAGEEVWLEPDADAPTVLTEEQASKLNRETEEEMAALKDGFSPGIDARAPVDSLIVAMNARSMEDFVARFGTVFTNLADQLGWSEFVVLTGVRQPLLGQENDHPPVLAAEDHLLEAGFSRTEPHGLASDLEGFASILGSLFWIARCNAAAPHILFAARGSASVGTLCQYANIHFDIYEPQEANLLGNALEPNGLCQPPDGICREILSQTSAIPGRAIEL